MIAKTMKELFDVQPKTARRRKPVRRSFEPPMVPYEATNEIEEDVKSGAFRVNEVTLPIENEGYPWDAWEKRYFATVQKRGSRNSLNLYTQEASPRKPILLAEDVSEEDAAAALRRLGRQTPSEYAKNVRRLTSTRRIDDE